MLEHLLTKVDLLVVGGGMANTFLLAQGKAIGKSLAEPDRVEAARSIMAAAEAKGVPVILPVDVIVAKEVTRGTEYKTLPAEKIPASWHIVDTGVKTRELWSRRSNRRRPCSGTARSASSRSHHSPTARWRWPGSWPTRPRAGRPSSSAAATRSLRSRSRTWPTR